MRNPFPVRGIRTPRSRPKRTDSGWVRLGPRPVRRRERLGMTPAPPTDPLAPRSGGSWAPVAL